MYEEELKQIIQASHNNALTFFVGAGLSTLSGAPSWKGLIDQLCVELKRDTKDNYSSDEYLQIPQMYYYSIEKNNRKYYSIIKDKIVSSSLHPNDIHHRMLRLNPASFITTNYDELLEEAAIQHCQGYKIIACDAEVPQIYGDKYILKIHGDFRHENIVLKEEDYLNYSDNFKLIETMVKSIFSTNTVVFIGYGLNDYNIKLILNWTKALLGTNFRKPIFIYTGNIELSKEELQYQESKGLSVIDTNKMITSTDYLSRYQIVFTELEKMSKTTIDNKTEDEAFEILYDLLAPLDKLFALRVSDVSNKLSPHVYIDETGTIQASPNVSILLTKFISIYHLPDNEKNNLSTEVLNKYKIIRSVFKKARIYQIVENHKWYIFIDEATDLGDKKCIGFDYLAMRDFVSRDYKDIAMKYKKAYYLARLDEFDRAFLLFSQVAIEAFKRKNYLLYYLAEANCISLKTAIKNKNKYYNCYDLETVESLTPTEHEIEHLFSRLPAAFRDTYSFLKDLHSANLFYKYSYEASIDSKKLAKAIESNSLEFGLSSSDQVICKINSPLHFLLGNGIVSDMFVEYKNTVANLMSQLVRQYSTQGRKTIHFQTMPQLDNRNVYFDEIDFYCLIEYFNDKDLNSLFYKHHIEIIEFHNMDIIEQSIKNIIHYYQYALKHSSNNVDVLHLQVRIKTCLMLLRYVNISQELVDFITDFIMNNEFREILINDKILFFDYQIYHRKKYSPITTKVIEKKLLDYLDREISARENKEYFSVPSTDSRISYYNLVHYIWPEEELYVSRKLSLRISKIINKNLVCMNKGVADHLCTHVSLYEKRKLITWAKTTVENEFRYDVFKLLIRCDARVDRQIVKKLQYYLHSLVEQVQNGQRNTNKESYPKYDPYDTLNEVGFFCLIKRLRKNDFSNFLGVSPLFDFYLLYDKFDFDRFNVSWLLNYTQYALDKITANEKVKTKIRKIIKDTLKDKNIIDNDTEQLKRILVEHFC